MFVPKAGRVPAVSIRSLTAIGTPASRPPRAASASRRTASASSSMKITRSGSTRSSDDHTSWRDIGLGYPERSTHSVRFGPAARRQSLRERGRRGSGMSNLFRSPDLAPSEHGGGGGLDRVDHVQRLAVPSDRERPGALQ